MPLVTSYTDTSIAEYMRSTLQATAATLGWTDTAHVGYVQATHEVLRAYPVSTVAGATNMTRLEALARREVWRQAMAETVKWMDASSGEERASLAQLFAHVRAMFLQAEADVRALPVVGTDPTVGGTSRQSTAHIAEVYW